jgi:sugar O-acyltransferase (sialic acid O-acetyltransferase NeuD family)
MNATKKIALFGFGGHAREVAVQIGGKITHFVDDEYSNEFCLPISDFDPSIYLMMIAIADPFQRKIISERLPAETEYFTFIHPSAKVMDQEKIVIGEGSFIGANCILTTNISIGKHTILNRGNQIGHDCSIGNYFSAMPGSVVSGNVSIGDGVYFGTNSCIIEKKKLANNITIGAGGVVIRNIDDPGVYAGVPVKKIK